MYKHLLKVVMVVAVMAAGASAQTEKPDALNTAIRGASDYLNSKIPKGSKIVVLNVQSNSPELSDYIIDELIANAVNDRVFTVVSRKQLDDVRKEQTFQMSGEVDDKDALAIGRIFGAQTIVSGVVGPLGAVYSLRINALDVQTAQVQGQYNKNIASSQIISSLMGSGGYSAPRTTPAASAPAVSTAAGVPTPLVKGSAVPGSNITEKLVWLQKGAESHNTYVIEVNADENIASHTLEFPNIINITVALRGLGANRNVRLGSNGTMFTVKPNVTFILESNVTLHGHGQNAKALIVADGGTFIMNAKTSITGNNGGDGRGWGNSGGGGVHVANKGTFTMNGGAISGNTANSGGGVYVYNGTFTINGGSIVGNTADNGGGLYVNSGTFTQTGGTIHGNTAKSSGGGVYVNGGTFNMRGGDIAKNTAVASGGGVCVNGGAFAKTGGTITGYKSDANNGNAVIDGTPLPRGGHAVFVSPTVRKETTAGTTVNLSYNNRKPGGAWDQ